MFEIWGKKSGYSDYTGMSGRSAYFVITSCRAFYVLGKCCEYVSLRHFKFITKQKEITQKATQLHAQHATLLHAQYDPTKD